MEGGIFALCRPSNGRIGLETEGNFEICESIYNYVTELKLLAAYCGFGD